MAEFRRLSTILFADIAGYTALMQADEPHALTLLGVFRQTLEHEVPQFEGEIVQYFGDGCMLSFPNSSQAVQCSLALQRGFNSETHVPVRVGMHLGDVVFKDGNAFGDGVNIASRIESLGVPGCVLLSKSVRDQIRNKPEFQLVSLGFFDFVNVEETMEVFAVANPPLVVPRREEMKGKVKQSEPPVIPWHKARQTKKLALNLAIYFLTAWLMVEGFAFLVKQKDWDREWINILLIPAAFGVGSTLVVSIFKGRFNWRAIGVHALLVVMAIATVFYYFLHPNEFNPGSLRIVKLVKDQENPATAGMHSLAVLPFANLMNDDNQDYLLAGMHDGLISELGKLGDVRVISRTSTLPYAHTAKGMKEIGHELNVEAVVEGTLTEVDSTIDLRLKLIDVFPDEKTTWTQSFTTSFGQLPNLYHEVTRTVAAQIGGVVAPKSAKDLAFDSSVNPDAYRAYLKGSYYTGYLTGEGYQKAEDYFRQAIQLDSGFAAPYAGLASIWMAMKQKYLVSPDSANPVIRSLLDRALELDENSATVWSGFGAYHFTTTYNWQESENAFKKAIALNPNFSMARNNYAHLLMILNRWDEAWEQMNYALNIDPENPWTIGFSAVMYGNSGKVLSASKSFDHLIDIVPENPMAVTASLMMHTSMSRYDEAVEDLGKMLTYIGQGQLTARLDSVYSQSDFQTAVRAVAESLEAKRPDMYIAPSFMIRIYGLLLHDKDKFLDCLEEMYEENDPDLGYFGIRHPDDPLQKEPRYIAVMEKIGLW